MSVAEMPQVWQDRFAAMTTAEIRSDYEAYREMFNASRAERRFHGVRMSKADIAIVMSLYLSALSEREG